MRVVGAIITVITAVVTCSFFAVVLCKLFFGNMDKEYYNEEETPSVEVQNENKNIKRS